MSTVGENMLKFCIDNMSKIILMNDDDGNNDYGSIIKSTLIKKTMNYWETRYVPICRRKANRNSRYRNQSGIFPGDSHNHYFPLACTPHRKNTHTHTHTHTKKKTFEIGKYEAQ